MNFLRKLAAACTATVLALSASAASVSAQGLSPWTGFYVGLNAGYGWASDTDPSVKGFVGGIHGGYNWQFSQIVAGIEADYSFSGMNAEAVIGGTAFDMNVDSMWSVRARLGFLAANNLMIYGTAGYGGFDVNVKATTATTFSDIGNNARGFVAGGGLEYAFTRNVLGRIEGLHYMGEGTGNFRGVDQDVTVVRAGLSYKF